MNGTHIFNMLATVSDNRQINGAQMEHELQDVRKLLKRWSGGRELNPRRPAWEAGILPLNYPRLRYPRAWRAGSLPNKLLRSLLLL